MRHFLRGSVAALLTIVVNPPYKSHATTEVSPHAAAPWSAPAFEATDALVRLSLAEPSAPVAIPPPPAALPPAFLPPALLSDAPAPVPPVSAPSTARHMRAQAAPPRVLSLEIEATAATPAGPAPARAAFVQAKTEAFLELAAQFQNCTCRVKFDPGAIDMGHPTHGVPLPGTATSLALPDPVIRVSWAL